LVGNPVYFLKKTSVAYIFLAKRYFSPVLPFSTALPYDLIVRIGQLSFSRESKTNEP